MTMSFVRLIGSWWLMLISCMKKKSMKKEDVVITTFSIEVEGRNRRVCCFETTHVFSVDFLKGLRSKCEEKKDAPMGCHLCPSAASRLETFTESKRV
jgi:hypothetical protein